MTSTALESQARPQDRVITRPAKRRDWAKWGLGAYFVLFPRARVITVVPVLFYPLFVELPAFVFLGLWFALQFISGLGSIAAATGGEPAGGVAFWAHVAGFVAGVSGVLVFRRPERERVEWWNDLS